MKGRCGAGGELPEDGRFGERQGKRHRVLMSQGESSEECGAVCQMDAQEAHAKKK